MSEEVGKRNILEYVRMISGGGKGTYGEEGSEIGTKGMGKES